MCRVMPSIAEGNAEYSRVVPGRAVVGGFDAFDCLHKLTIHLLMFGAQYFIT